MCINALLHSVFVGVCSELGSSVGSSYLGYLEFSSQSHCEFGPSFTFKTLKFSVI